MLGLGVELMDPSGELAARYQLADEGCVLVRPDGYVAWGHDSAGRRRWLIVCAMPYGWRPGAIGSATWSGEVSVGCLLVRDRPESRSRRRHEQCSEQQPRRSHLDPGVVTSDRAARVARAGSARLVRRRSRVGPSGSASPPGDLYVDLSKNLIDDEVLASLLELGEQVGLAARRDAMFAGERINVTENRAVLHTALRDPDNVEVDLDGTNVVPLVHEELQKVYAFADKVRSGEWRGVSGKQIETVVNIGIGGSDLGPVMVYEALKPYVQPGLTARFVSNIDPTDVAEKTGDLDPETTLFIVASKTFTTLETLTNARLARSWLLHELKSAGVIDDTDAGRQGRDREALRGRLHRTGQGGRVRHRSGQRLRLLGLGGRPVLRRLGHRHRRRRGDRAGELRRLPGRLPRHRRTLPLDRGEQERAGPDGSGQRLVRQLPRLGHARRAPVLAVSAPFPGVPPAADHGVQRQERALGRQPGDDRDG